MIRSDTSPSCNTNSGESLLYLRICLHYHKLHANYLIILITPFPEKSAQGVSFAASLKDKIEGYKALQIQYENQQQPRNTGDTVCKTI